MRDKNVSTSVGSFHLNGKWYDHRIYCSDDDRVECLDEDGNVILVFDSHGSVRDHNKQLLGRFKLSGNNWLFESKTQKVVGETNLLKAEIEVAKLYIQGELK